MARGDEFSVVYVDGDVPQRPIQLGQLLVDSSLISAGVTNLQQCTSQTDPAVYEPLQGGYPETSAETTAGVTIVNYLYPPLNVLRYGTNTVPGTTDMTAAFQAAIDVSTAQYNATVTIPNGYYLISDELVVPQGTMLVAPGSQGSTAGFGTTILHASNGNCFTWDGTGTAFRGTGGGLKNVFILKANGFSGGYALNLVATDPDHRAGETMLENILVAGTGSGLWARGLNIDGTGANVAGSRGVRSVVGIKLRLSCCTEDYKYVSLNQAVHCTFVHLQVDTVTGTGIPGLTIEGFAENVSLVGAIINGTVKVESPADNINLQGRISFIDQNSTDVSGSFIGSAIGPLANASKNFRISCSQADSVFAYRTATSSSVTGAGTLAPIICTTESYDRNNVYDNTTGTYTAGCAGDHIFVVSVTLDALAVANTTGVLHILHKNAGGSTVNSIEYPLGNVGAMADANGNLNATKSVVLSLSEGDTILPSIAVFNGAGDTVDIFGSGATRYTYFDGRLLA